MRTMDSNREKKRTSLKDMVRGIGTMVLAIVSFLLVCQILVVIVKLVIG